MRDYGFGWIPDGPDARDKPFTSAPRARLAPELSQRPLDSPVENQLQTNSCVGNAVVAAYEFLHNNLYGHYTDMSRLFPYYNARAYMGWEGEDSGCMIRDAVKGLVKYGTCPEYVWPFNTNKVTTKPSTEAYTEGEKYQLLDYYRIYPGNRVYDVRYALSCGYAVVFGAAVYDSFYESQNNGVVPMPNLSRDRLEGFHAMKVSGYSMPQKREEIKNSWGRYYGDDGYVWIPDDFIDED